MQNLLTAVAWSMLWASSVTAEDVAPPQAWSPSLMMQVKKIGSVVVSPDGQRVAFAVRQAVMEGDVSEYRTHIHVANTDGSQPRQLTQGEKSCDDPQWSPDGKWIAFVSGRVGKKNLWAIPIDGGEAAQLTELKSDVGSFRWSPLGSSLAFTSIDAPTEDEERRTREKDDAKVVDENIKLNRLHVVDFAAPPQSRPQPRQLTTGPLSIVSDARAGRSGYDWSPDGKTLIVAHASSPRPDEWPSADLSLVDVASGTVQRLVNANSADTSPLFSPDGESIAYTASDDPPTWGGTRTVCVIPSTGGPPTKLAGTRDGFGRYSELVGWSEDGSRLYFTEVHGTSMKVLALPMEGDPVEISPGEGLSASGMSLGGVSLNAKRTHFGFGWEKLNQPPEAFVSAVSKFDPAVVSSVHSDLTKPPSGRTEVVRWKSTEDMEIEGLLTYPVGYEQGKRCPLLLVIHGGPMGVFTET
ncbi:MAG: PD40 domain-containing protein, partial [Candidatus Saccharimonas sp.]|nr:PD40 domain-containing protein [Planctomycetaceae bacterium]